MKYEVAHGEPKARSDETKPIASPNSFMVRYVIIYMTLLLHTHQYTLYPPKPFCNVDAIRLMYDALIIISGARESLIVARQSFVHKGIHFGRVRMARVYYRQTIAIYMVH